LINYLTEHFFYLIKISVESLHKSRQRIYFAEIVNLYIEIDEKTALALNEHYPTWPPLYLTCIAHCALRIFSIMFCIRMKNNRKIKK
jgi:hypothetical protein